MKNQNLKLAKLTWDHPSLLDEAASAIDNNIAIIADIISACSRIYEPSSSDGLTEVRDALIDFSTIKYKDGKIKEEKEEGAEICAKERTEKPQALELHQPRVSLSQQQIETLKKDSLLNHLFCSALPSGGGEFSLAIINAIISSCDDLSGRPDLLLMMIDQRCISSPSDSRKLLI